MEVFWLINILLGVVTAVIASNKGRNAVGWFFFGFFFGLVALIVVCIVGNLKQERARHDRARKERRRLMEELRMEKVRNREAHGHTQTRLAMHDRAIGIDTSQVDPRRALSGGTAPSSPPPHQPVAAFAEWYYAVGAKDRVGPLLFSQMAGNYRDGKFGMDDLVWKSGWAEWRRLAEVDGLASALGS